MEEREPNHVGHSPETGVSATAELARISKALHRLTVAVWIACLVATVSFVAPWVVYFFDLTPTRESASPEAEFAVPEPSLDGFDNDFPTRPLDQKISRATVILLTETRQEGDRHREIIAEIVKQAPGVRFYYKVGDELESMGHRTSPDCDAECRGDGQVVFMTGNPARMTMTMSHFGGRVRSLGDMPLAELRKLSNPG